MAVFSMVPFQESALDQRWDAEAFTPYLRKLNHEFAESPRLIDLASVTHASEIPRVYTDEADAVPFLLAQNIKPFLPDTSNPFSIPPSVASKIPNNRLQYGDVLVTRSGAYSGVACVYLGKDGDFYTSGEGLIVRSRGGIDGAYLVALLNTQAGQALCFRCIYGSGQPHLQPRYLETIPVLRLGDAEEKVAQLIREAHNLIEAARNEYPEAQAELLNRMGWQDLEKRPLELCYVEDFKTLDSAERIDAEHFQPRSIRLRDHLRGQSAEFLGRFCPKPNRGVQPEFVENGGIFVIDSKAVRPEGVEPDPAECTSREFSKSPNAAKGRIQKHDVLLNSTGRGTLGRAAHYDLDRLAIADNHVAIIRPDPSVCLPAYLSLFLNSPAGLAQSEMFQTGSSGQLELYPQHIQQFLIFLPRTKSGKIDLTWQETLAAKIESATCAKTEAREKLEAAKGLVEAAIARRPIKHS